MTENGHDTIVINNNDRAPLVRRGGGTNMLPASIWSARTVPIDDERPTEVEGEALEDILFTPSPISMFSKQKSRGS